MHLGGQPQVGKAEEPARPCEETHHGLLAMQRGKRGEPHLDLAGSSPDSPLLGHVGAVGQELRQDLEPGPPHWPPVVREAPRPAGARRRSSSGLPAHRHWGEDRRRWPPPPGPAPGHARQRRWHTVGRLGPGVRDPEITSRWAWGRVLARGEPELAMWSEPIPAVARQRFPGRYGRLPERSDRCDHLAPPEFFCAAFLRAASAALRPA